MLPRFWMAWSRFTITLRVAIAAAPTERSHHKEQRAQKTMVQTQDLLCRLAGGGGDVHW